MREKESIVLLLYLFQVCRGIIIREKSVNKKLMSSQDIYIDLFVLFPKYETVIQIPENKRKYYQIESGASGIYNVSNGSSVTVNKYGTITPRNATLYCYGEVCLEKPQPSTGQGSR